MHKNLFKSLENKLEAVGLLPLRNQAELSTKVLQERLELILPWAMNESGLDFWVIAARENNLDPVLNTLYTWDMPDVRRESVLVFIKDLDQIHKIALGPISPEMEKIYKRGQEVGESAWQALVRLVDEYQPKKIAINKSMTDGFCDGLSATMYQELKDALGPRASKLQSAEALSIRWLQRITPLEQDLLKVLVELTQAIIKFSFSKESIEVGKTTTTDVEWIMRDIINRLGFTFWFGPDVDLQRKGSKVSRMFNEVIKPGDLLHCDIGLKPLYIQLHTDMQWVAYLLRAGETEAPQEFSDLLAKGNRLQDLVRENMATYQSGNDVLVKSLKEAQTEGIKPMIYTHPLGTFGHGAGPTIGKFDQQRAVSGAGERMVEDKTAYALELNVSEQIQIWDDQLVFMYLEEVVCKDGTVKFPAGRQEELLLI